MVVIGVDAHKRTHTVVAVDEAGRKLAEWTAASTADGHLELLGWSRTWPSALGSRGLPQPYETARSGSAEGR